MQYEVESSITKDLFVRFCSQIYYVPPDIHYGLRQGFSHTNFWVYSWFIEWIP